MPLIPAPWPVLHTPRGVEEVVDAHGNSKVVDGDPVIRYVIALFQNGIGSSDEINTVEYLSQVGSMLRMVIPAKDIGFYKSGDLVLVGGSVVDGDYVGGVAFRLDGNPASDLEGPWPRFYRNFGGYVRIRRAN